MAGLDLDPLAIPVTTIEAIIFTNEMQEQAKELASSIKDFDYFQKEFDEDVKSLPSVKAAVKRVNDALVNCVDTNNDTYFDCKCPRYADRYQEALQSLDNK